MDVQNSHVRQVDERSKAGVRDFCLGDDQMMQRTSRKLAINATNDNGKAMPMAMKIAGAPMLLIRPKAKAAAKIVTTIINRNKLNEARMMLLSLSLPTKNKARPPLRGPGLCDFLDQSVIHEMVAANSGNPPAALAAATSLVCIFT